MNTQVSPRSFPVENVDLSVNVMGQHLALPFYCSPTALQRLFHHQRERAVAAATAKYGMMFGVSSLGTVSLEELRKAHDTPQVYQFYFHKDRGLNGAMLQRVKEARVGNHDADRGQHHRWQPRTRSTHRLFHTLQAHARRYAAVRDKAYGGSTTPLTSGSGCRNSTSTST
jgi:FMN-dependent dehydrogenase